MPIPLKINLKIEYSLDNGCVNRQTVILIKKKTESTLHITLKLLAYLYFYKMNRKLIIEPKFRYRRFKPDLVAFRNPEIPHEMKPEIDIWIECKKVKLSKLMKLARSLPSTKIYWFHLNHYIKRKLKTKAFSDSTNVKLIGVTLNRMNQTFVERSLLSQHPIWRVQQTKNSQLQISILNSKIDVDFQAIN
ncbi:hypothetical protein CEE45_05595 [Candidatus Heimdallarchaeota archaeon B3_Heim]|nr:MAG: hypothetical protein CEE45_05595 [Candidatus Heimdallarchaeota archaeon B3_Heim]